MLFHAHPSHVNYLHRGFKCKSPHSYTGTGEPGENSLRNTGNTVYLFCQCPYISPTHLHCLMPRCLL